MDQVQKLGSSTKRTLFLVEYNKLYIKNAKRDHLNV